MPDWITHLGTTYLAAQGASSLSPRLADIRYLLLGALLPDTTRLVVSLVDILDWPAVPAFTYFIPFHSLLLTALVAGAIAVLVPALNGSSLKAFFLMMAGAAFHFLLDDVEGLVGCGSTTFYPFYFGKPFSGWNSEGNFAAMLLVISAIALGVALGQRARWPAFSFQFTRQRLFVAAALLVTALVIPLFFRQWMVQQNAYFLGFAANPAAFEGQSVELCFSEIVNTRPVTVEEFDTSFVLHTSDAFNLGEWVSVRGVYRAKKIHPTTLVRHRGFSDVGLSFIAALVFVGLMVDMKQINAVQRLLKKQ